MLLRLLEPPLDGSVGKNRRWVDAASMWLDVFTYRGEKPCFGVGLRFPQGIRDQLQALRASALVGEYWKRNRAAIARLRRHCRQVKVLLQVLL